TAVVPTAIHFVARYGRTDRMEGGRFEGSNESSVSGYVTLHEITERPADGPQVVELSTDQAYRYYRYVSPAGSYGNIAEFSIEGVAPSDSSDGGGGEPVVEEESDSGSVEGFAQTEVDGRMIFGLDPAWAEGREFDKVFDGDPDTFYDYLYGEEASFVGFDNGVAERPVQIRFSPRSSGRFPERMIGGKFQGSNESVHSGYVTLHEVSQTPASSGETVELTVAESYRYYRYLAPAGSFGNIAEFTVSMADETQVSEPEPTPEPNPEPTPDPAPEGYRESGIHFGLDPVWREGRGFEAVFDGDPDTYYDFRYSTRSSYVGIDKTEAFVPAEIRYTPRKGWAARILGGRFQGSNESRTSGYETIHMVITFTDDGEQVVQLEPSEAYRYYRYLAPAGSYGNIAEFDVLSAEEAAAESEASEPDTETEPVETEPEDDGSGEPGGDPAEPGDEDSAADLPSAIAVDGVRDLGGNGVEISFSLPEAGKVSAAVFNAYGQQVRTLAMGEEYEPGTHAMIWDGLDRNGRPVPAGEYSFKLLRSDGFTARYVANLGINPGSASYDTWVGNHDGGASVAVDSSGVYIAGQITETAPVLIKQSFDGSTRHWEKTRMDVTDGRFQGGISLASNGQGTVYMLQQNGRLQVIDADSGYKKASWDVLPSGVSRSDERYELIYEHLDGQVAPADMSAQGNYLVLSFRDANKLVWLNPANGSVIKEYGMTAPLGVAVNAAGEVYVIRDNRIFRIVDSSARVVVDSNLDAPQRIDYDASNDTLLVVDGIEGGTVKRFSLDGELLARHGRDGGRLNGSYVAEDFHAVRDITADGQGGFFVSEPNSPPRRIAHVDGDGTILNEWFGGQNYYAWAEPDPKEKGEVWINSGNGLVLVDLDFETGDWDVVESYILDDLAGGLISAVGGHQGMWQVVYDGDQRYLISEFVPQVLYHEPGALHGVSVTSNHTDQLEFAK
ncbi:MAG: FlgD immunoglobulin-like domain containing protein, partial [Spirochaetota bacterium]